MRNRSQGRVLCVPWLTEHLSCVTKYPVGGHSVHFEFVQFTLLNSETTVYDGSDSVEIGVDCRIDG